MCGIFGLFATGADSPVLHTPVSDGIEALSLLKHRGPDAQRACLFYPDAPPHLLENLHDPAVSSISGVSGMLGHTRLSIIDTRAAGHQPMPDATGSTRYWISYNGEVYNYRELRQELIAQGWLFLTETDTEVLLALYIAHGPCMIERLNGMFAMAIWDVQAKTLFLARDRYGVKPLYCTHLPNGEFAFASEIKALLSLPGAPRGLNPLTLFEHLTFQNHFGDKTLASGIQMLEPGHWAMLDTRSGSFSARKYWEPVFQPAGVTTIQNVQALTVELRERFEQAVSRQLVGDVPIGSFLSGGMDTGAITAVAARKIPGLHTYTAGFDVSALDGQDPLEAYFDERAAARDLARRMGTAHHDMLIGAEALSRIFPQVVWHLDDFRVGISYQNFLVSRMVQDFSTVVLSGVGGDELLAGYPWRYEPVMHLHDPAAFEAEYYRRWVRFLTDEQKHRLLSPAMNRAVGDVSTRAAFSEVLAGCRAEHPLNKALCFDMKTFLHGLLIVEDRLSMAHSVESRVPFLDNDLVDFCLRLPADAKLCRPTGQEVPVAKWILKEALHDLLPEAVIHRRKQGFTPPDASWYRGPLRGFVEDLLLSERALGRNLFNPAEVRRIVVEHQDGRANHRFLLWSLICLETWQRHFLDQPPT